MTGLDDKTFLSLELGDDRLSGIAVVCHRLTAPGGGFYGGAALALACSMMEYATDLPTVWCTAQLVSRATLDDVVDLRSSVIAGRQTTQLRITATVSGRELFTACGATGAGDPRLSKTFVAMLTVSAPEESPPVKWFFNTDPEHTYFGVVEFREATVLARAGCEPPARAFWVRFKDAPTWTAARLAFVADLASTGIVQAANKAVPGRWYGRSLDSTLRAGSTTESEWVLVALHPELVHSGFGQGTVRLWDPDGSLLGIGSQTFMLKDAAS